MKKKEASFKRDRTTNIRKTFLLENCEKFDRVRRELDDGRGEIVKDEKQGNKEGDFWKITILI